ncbi:MAG: SseB family protein [Lachnospiraceae bacterium]|nr:SseB family protein [Lachnospiraceae bacterium]
MAITNKEPQVHNEALEEALKVFKAEQSQENMQVILKHLAEATLIQPALFPKNISPQEMAKIVKSGKPNPALKPQPVLIKTKEGKAFFPVFTSKEQIPADQKYPFLLFLPYTECAKIAAKEELKLEGIAINPFTDNLVLHQQMQAAMKAAQDAADGAPGVRKVTLNASQMHEFLRNQVERQELPRRMFAEKESFFTLLTDGKEEALSAIYKEMYDKVSGNQEKAPVLSSPYTEEDFELLSLNINEQTQLIQVTMPKKNRLMGQCSSAFLIRNPQTDECAYYTVRVTEKEKANVLGQVTGDGAYHELGDAPDEGSELYYILGILPWAKTTEN